MGRALGLCGARGEPFGGSLSGAAGEQPATVGVGPECTLGGVLRCPRDTRTTNGRGVHPPRGSTRLESSSTDRPHLALNSNSLRKIWGCKEPVPKRKHQYLIERQTSPHVLVTENGY